MKSLSVLPKLITGASIVAGLGVAALPLGSASADSKTASSTVTVNVPATIEVASTNTSFDVSANGMNSGTFDATVTTNSVSGYTIGLHAATTDLVNSTVKTYKIPANVSVSAGTDAWAIKGGDKSDYTAMTTSSVVFATKTTTASSEKTTFTVGASTAAAKPSGAYSTTVTVTALTK